MSKCQKDGAIVYRGYGVQAMGPIGNGGTGGMGYRGMGHMGNRAQGVWGTRAMGHIGNGSHGQWGTWAMGYRGMGNGAHGRFAPKISKRCQVVKKMSSCQKDVKCQIVKHADYGGGSQKK